VELPRWLPNNPGDRPVDHRRTSASSTRAVSQKEVLPSPDVQYVQPSVPLL
jgi:hypothetical protein